MNAPSAVARPLHLAANLGGWLAWLVWMGPLARWLAAGFADEDGGARLLVALVGAGCLARDVDLRTVRARLERTPEPDLACAAWIGAGAALTLAAPELHTARAIGGLAAGYGLLGAYVSRAAWRRVGAAVPLAIAALPTGAWVDALIGWPLRKAIAAVAAALLGGMPTSTVIAIEGGFAHVDLPCAGVRSLWIGAAAVCAVALWRRVPVSPRLAAVGGLFAAVAIAANVARVTAIVGLAHVAGLPLLADTVHQPLGVVGFAAALGCAWWAMPSPTEPARPTPNAGRPVIRALAAAGLVAGALSCAITERGAASTSHALITAVPLPDGWVETEATAVEVAFADDHGARLTHGRDPSTGAAVAFVASRSWLGHHAPERCLRATGWTVSGTREALVDGRWVRIADVARDGQRATAVWWFQRGTETTDDVTVRIRDGWFHPSHEWVLVSALVPEDVATEPVARELMTVASRETGGGAS